MATKVSLPFPMMTLRAKRHAHVVAITESPMVVTNIIIPKSCTKSFLIHELIIEGQPSLSCGPVPALVFSEQAIGVALSVNISKSGSIVHIIFENTAPTDEQLVFTIFGTAFAAMWRSARTPPEDGREYHAWVSRRQRIYENLHSVEGEDCFFNGEEILPDTFLPKTSLWWVDDDGWKKRPVYHFEAAPIGTKKGGLQVVDIETYEGFE